MTDGKTRTIRRWNDSRIGENPIRFLPPALILARKHRWLWPYRSRRAALSAREGGKAFGVALFGHVVAKNQPLVVTDLARDPRFAESPVPKARSISLLRRSAAAWSQRVWHSERPSPLNQVNDQDNDRNHEQQMDQSSAHMTEKTEKPENDENYKYSPQHRFYFRLISFQ
jgi:hypothetical protein